MPFRHSRRKVDNRTAPPWLLKVACEHAPAIAVAHLESWRDGKLAPTGDRIDTVLDALGEIDALIGVLYAASRNDET